MICLFQLLSAISKAKLNTHVRNCQTGLGDVKGSEGVFGLQRAFKMAGVRYLMMSLWSVPDKETKEFMEKFYTHWLSGIPIREAFQTTQKEMRLEYPKEPYKWAAFVLVE